MLRSSLSASRASASRCIDEHLCRYSMSFLSKYMAYLSRFPCGYVVSRHGAEKWSTTDLSHHSLSCRLHYRRGHAMGTPLSNVHHTLSCASLLSGCPFRSGCSRDASSLPNSHVLVGDGFIIIDHTHFISWPYTAARHRYRALARTLFKVAVQACNTGGDHNYSLTNYLV
jgi:hypothetical protein